MQITVEEKAEIKGLLLTDSKVGMRRLFTLKNSNLKRVEDKYYVLFSLALMHKRFENIELAKEYIEELKVIMDRATSSHRMEKAMTLWLYIEIYKDLNDYELLNIYKEIYNNIKHLGEFDEKVLGVKANIGFINKDYKTVMNIFEDCLVRQYIETVDSILADLKIKNGLVYEKALILKSKNDYTKDLKNTNTIL